MIKKALYIIIFSFFIVNIVQAAMSSSNFDIWLDDVNSGGGRVETGSGSYTIDSTITSQTNPPMTSTNYREISSFSAIEDEPTVGFNVQSVTLNFGELSPEQTATSTHTFAAYTNSVAGYSIKVFGDPLKTPDYTLSEIGSTPASSAVGTEQFGLNLVANTSPGIGLDPSGGVGQAAINYDTQNQFSYSEGDEIANADSFSYQTNFSVSVIVNIADNTPAGAYSTTLTYEFIPVF